MSMTEREYILLLMSTGEPFRLIDGRWKDGFVDPEILQELVSEGKAEIYKSGSMDFVRGKDERVP